MLQSVQEAVTRGRVQPVPLHIEHFQLWVMLREFFFHACFPISTPVLLATEGLEGLRRREMLLPIDLKSGWNLSAILGRISVAAWFLVLPGSLWTVLLLTARHFPELRRAQCQVDVLYVLSIVFVQQLAVARKWAMWDAEDARRITSSYESKRSEEMISGWLAFSPSVAVALTVRAVQQARLDHVEAVRVLVQASPYTTAGGMCKDILLEQQQRLGGSAAPAHQQQQQPPPSDCFSSSTINALHTTDRLLHVSSSSSDPGPVSSLSADAPPTLPHKQQAATAWGEDPPPPGQQQQQQQDPSFSHPFAAPLPSKRSERGGQEAWVSPSLLFAQVALQLGMTGYWKERAVGRAGVALLGASLPSLTRALIVQVPPMGSTPEVQLVVLLCALLQFMSVNTFILPFLESSRITFRRMMVLSRELVGLTTQDPDLLAYAKLRTRRLPYFMPLCYNTNLAAWLRLRSAAHSFGLSFRGRIEFFLSVLLVRTAIGVGWLLVELMRHRRGPPVLVLMLEFDLAVFLSGVLSMMLVATKIDRFTDWQVLQLKRLRLEASLAYAKAAPPALQAADVAEAATVTYALDYVETYRSLKALRLLGVPMTSRGVASVMAGLLPVMSALYYSYLRNKSA